MTADDIDALVDEVLVETGHANSGEFQGVVDRRPQAVATKRNSSSGRTGGSDRAAQGRTASGKVAARATSPVAWQRPRFPPAAFAASRGGRVGHFLLGCMLRRALRPVVDLWLDRPSLIRLDLPEGCSTERAAKALRKLMLPLDQHTEAHANTNYIGQTHVIEIEKEERVKSVEAARRRQLTAMMLDLKDRGTLSRRVFLVVEHGADLAPEISGLCDHQLALLSWHRRHVAAACRLFLDLQPDEAMLDQLTAVPFGEIDLILRPGTRRDQLRGILMARAKKEAVPSKAGLVWTATLDTLPGMGDATVWGLDLAQDLRDWRDGLIGWQDVDRGVLLHGSPGTGKTTFAKALATSCKVPLIATSVTQWQATGHLGDLLAAMRRSFAEARDQAPSILFLDELDSVGVRAEFGGDNRNYGIQVVNGLLECLDGVESREGIVVVGACNDPATIDPAVLRAGRLDRMIEIPLPDQAARAAILRVHLGRDAERIERLQGAASQAVNRKPVNRESDKASSGAMDRTDIPILDRVAARIVGASGADIERMVRDARRIARRARRSLEADDLLSLAPPPLRLSDEERWRFAVHEIGHAVAIVTSSSDHLLSVWMIGKDEAGPREGGMIAAAHSHPPGRAVFTLADLQTELVKLIAGTAAEAVLLGSRSTGASGEANSDLARATQIAARIELHHGLGYSLAAITSEKPQEIARLLQRDQGLRDRVENRIRTAYNKAEALIRDNVDVVEELAQDLMERGELRGDEVRQVVERASGREASRPS